MPTPNVLALLGGFPPAPGFVTVSGDYGFQGLAVAGAVHQFEMRPDNPLNAYDRPVFLNGETQAVGHSLVTLSGSDGTWTQQLAVPPGAWHWFYFGPDGQQCKLLITAGDVGKAVQLEDVIVPE